MRRLPPLNAIRAFEAAGRHLSFTKAADELSVTPAAISQQVRNLEDSLGVSLFRRLTRALLLTEAGQTALPLLGQGFDQLETAIEQIRQQQESGILTVSSVPSFAARWLVRRLPRFDALHPDIRVRLDPTLKLADFDRDNIDLAVRYGLGGYPGMRTDLLMPVDIAPVCSPKLLEGNHPLCRPDDLRHHTLLQTDWTLSIRNDEGWAMWLKSSGVDDIDPTSGSLFTTDALTVEAALQGNGVALLARSLVADDVAAGRLVWPFELVVKSNFSFYIVCPERTANAPKIAAFRQWLLEEAQMENNP
jgi:LysR family glycine cleavage system transcriptional activator